MASSTVATTWSYLPNAGDRRLAGIANVGLATSQQSTYQITTTPENFITSITETSDTSTVYPAAATQTASYNNLNQLSTLSGQSLSYDANGNLLSDGQRVYAWDAENRLVKITYPAQTGKQTSFVYDGLDRRVKIISTPAGGGAAVTTRYTWCGTAICQSRVSGNVAARAYYAEGEVVYGPPVQRLYYGVDQIGSVRRAFASTSSAPAYAYDPYGNALQPTALLTDFGFAGMLYNADSGLYLTQFRGYDPVAGRWLSRDPLGEGSDAAANLYAYVGGEPIDMADPSGLDGIFVHYVGYMAQTGLGFAAPVGHSGVVSVNPQTGDTSYYDFGRYGGQYGDVRTQGSVGQIQFDKNGQPTSDSLSNALRTASERFGHGAPVYYEYYKDANSQQIDKFAHDRAGDLANHPYNLPFNTCNNFAHEAIRAAGGSTPSGIGTVW